MGESFNEDDFVPVDGLILRPARGGPGARLADAAWWVYRHAVELRRVPPWRRLRWVVQRARRGWADPDVWNLHNYLRQVTGGMVLQLRDRGGSWPGGDLAAPGDWAAILTAIAVPLLVDPDRDVDGESLAGHRIRQTCEIKAQREALHLMADWFHHLWD